MKKKWLGYFLLGIIIWGFILGGCAPKKEIPLVPEKLTTSELKNISGQAWEKKNYFRAENLYWQLVQRPGLSLSETVLAWKRLTYSSIYNQNYQKAKLGLRKWSEFKPDIKNTWVWQQAYLLFLKEMGKREHLLEYGSSLMEREEISWGTKFKALKFLDQFFWSIDQYTSSWQVHKKIYAQLKDESKKSELERYLAERLKEIDQRTWKSKVADSYPKKEYMNYPYALIQWANIDLRFQEGLISWTEAWRGWQDILKESSLVIKDDLNDHLISLEKKYGQPVKNILLLLPLDGAYSDLGWKICRGADIAQWQEADSGISLQVKVINTCQENWFDRLKKDTEGFSLVGGPLRENIWKTIYESGWSEKKIFFAFRSSLHPGWEGIDGYRFFPSSKDQVKPVINFLVEELGITRFGIFYPESKYGRRMASTFWREVVQRQAEVKALRGYSSKDQPSLKKEVAKFLKVPKQILEKENLDQETNATKVKRPDPDFEAVFLPDSFSQARMIVPEFFYFNEDRLIFIGPTLWSQEMSEINMLDRHVFKLAIMTGAWWPNSSQEGRNKLKKGLQETAQREADFWVGLGYDFVRFAASLGPVNSNWQPEKVNQILSKFSNFEWSMASLSWNDQGQASQDMYVLRPWNEITRLEDYEKFKSLWEWIKKRHEMRQSQNQQENRKR